MAVWAQPLRVIALCFALVALAECVQVAVRNATATAASAAWPQNWLAEGHKPADLEASQQEADAWAEEVKGAMKHSWSNYRERAWGMDDIHPLTGKGSNWCGGAVTMVDALSTLRLMGMDDEFNDAVEYFRTSSLPREQPLQGKTFEITIRLVGGLISAYELSKDPVLLEQARRIGDVILASYNGAIAPASSIHIQSPPAPSDATSDHWGSVAVVGSSILEMSALSAATGSPSYAASAFKGEHKLLELQGAGGGLVANSGYSADSVGTIGIGREFDSYYEYLLKAWLQDGQKDGTLRRAWMDSVGAITKKILRKDSEGMPFLPDNGNAAQGMDHMACFFPGSMFLAADSLPASETKGWRQIADDLTDTCYNMYARSPTSLAPEVVGLDLDGRLGDVQEGNAINRLRPEALEALYYRWYMYGDPEDRRKAYRIFQAFQQNSKTKYGYCETRTDRPQQLDTQESFWFAETLKYMYLIFSPREKLDLKKWVLTTEGHPVPIAVSAGQALIRKAAVEI